MNKMELKDGEVPLALDIENRDPDAGLVFIGTVHSPWMQRADCPKNMKRALERGQGATIELAPPFRPGLTRFEGISHIIVLFWFDQARRDIIVKTPRHSDRPSGIFALRSPDRPNSIGLSIAPVQSIDLDKGIIAIEAIDCLDGTPVIDLKPYLPSNDAIENADSGWHGVSK